MANLRPPHGRPPLALDRHKQLARTRPGGILHFEGNHVHIELCAGRLGHIRAR